jgi:hypothetical protein
MPRIKVTGYINPDSLEPDEVDFSNEGGVSNEGFARITNDLSAIDVEDVEYKLIEDGEE